MSTTATTVSFVVLVPRNLPTPNSRLHHQERARMIAAIRESAALQARANRRARGLSENRDEKRAVTLTLLRGKGQKMLDPDNATGALGVVVNALADSGWLADDSPALLDLTVQQERNEAVGPAVAVDISVPAS